MPLLQPVELQSLLQTPVAILGGGVSGRAVGELLEAVGASAQIYDEKGGEGQLSYFDPAAALHHRLVVFSPGFCVEHRWLATAAAAGCVCLTELDFASLFWRGQVLSITGTNGKTTLTEFLTHALRSVGAPAFATGNIGHSFSRLVLEQQGGAEGDTAVCEVSSYQAETLWHFRADAVLWTNFAEDHLERHPGLRAYFAAKLELVERCRSGRVFAGSSVAAYAEVLGFDLPRGAALSTLGLGEDPSLAGTVFEAYPQRENFEMAAAWWLSTGRPLAQLRAAAATFRLGRHRLALVATLGGVEWWNDSKATNFHAVEAALGRFARPVVLIAGGKAKGGDLQAFVERIAPQVRHVFLIGETRPVLAQACAAYSVAHTVCSSFEEALEGAAAVAVAGEQVLLSPGFASFDMFRGYDHRGDVFENWVRARPASPSSLS
jgi:UDP-N-acetylmuramoylalanine--D-glutamate ligase